jgi:threonine/homoserine/homoserine lactone efflux protein
VLSDGVHIAGGLVLAALGLQAWRGAHRAGAGEAEATRKPPRACTPGAAFGASLVSIAANPKAAVFAVSFLPQFLPRTGPVLLPLLALAAIQVIVDTAWTTGLVLLAAHLGAAWRRTAARAWLERVLGAILIALALDLAVDRP